MKWQKVICHRLYRARKVRDDERYNSETLPLLFAMPTNKMHELRFQSSTLHYLWFTWNINLHVASHSNLYRVVPLLSPQTLLFCLLHLGEVKIGAQWPLGMTLWWNTRLWYHNKWGTNKRPWITNETFTVRIRRVGKLGGTGKEGHADPSQTWLWNSTPEFVTP